MKIVEKHFDHQLHMWLMVCPICESILADGMELEFMPEFAICDCDKNGNKQPTYEMFDRGGVSWIRRNKYPRFVGRITFSTISDIEDVEWLDICTDAPDAAKAMRKASEFLAKISKA